MTTGIANIDFGRILQACRAEMSNGFQHLTSISGVCCLNCAEKDFEDEVTALEERVCAML